MGIQRTLTTSARFLGEFLSRPAATGAIAPSSAFLARAIVNDLDLPRAQAILEYGPGTGVFTEHILREIKPSSNFVAIVVNPQLARIFKTRHPDVTLVEDTVANVRAICDRARIDSVDSIVSGLPWAAFSQRMQSTFLDEMMRVLTPGGRFVTFAYVHGLW